MGEMVIAGQKVQYRPLLLSVIFTILMVLSSYVKVPLLGPVPVTLQTLVVFLSIIALKRHAYLPQCAYLSLGLAGLPVFAYGGGGIVYLAGPTGGYLIGFLLSVLVCGTLYGRIAHTAGGFGALMILVFAALIIYACGLVWLMALHNFTFSAGLAWGVVPFMVPDAVKIILAYCAALRHS